MRQNEILTARWNNETIELIKMISEYEEMNGLEAERYNKKIEEYLDKRRAQEIEHNNKLL